MSPPPLPFFAFDDMFRSRMIKKEITIGEWRMEVTQPEEEGNVYANIQVNGTAGATCDAHYKFPKTPFSVHATLSSVEHPSKHQEGCCTVAATAKDLLNRFSPAVTYKHKFHSFTAKPASGYVDYELVHPAFFGTASVNALGGLATFATLSTRIQRNIYGGMAINYDPFRSGLRNYTLSFLALNVKQAKHADFLVSYDGTRGPLLGVTLPLKDNLQGTATVRPLKATQTLLAGLDYRSPCGAQALVHVDVGQKLVGLSMSRLIHDTWRVSLGWTVSSANNTIAPKFGLAITKDF